MKLLITLLLCLNFNISYAKSNKIDEQKNIEARVALGIIFPLFLFIPTKDAIKKEPKKSVLNKSKSKRSKRKPASNN